MSTTKVRSNDMKLEIVVIPVSDVDRAKEFYGRLGWRLDAEFASGDDFRVIQFTPPGSGCSIIFGKNVTAAAPGSAQGLYLIVSDIAAAREELRGCGVEVSEVFHSDGVSAGTDEPYLFGRRRTSGRDPKRGSYRSFASFRDPDGNGWLFQEVTTRLAGRIDSGATGFASANDLANAFRRAEAAHGKHEATMRCIFNRLPPQVGPRYLRGARTSGHNEAPWRRPARVETSHTPPPAEGAVARAAGYRPTTARLTAPRGAARSAGCSETPESGGSGRAT
jgi:catechol 2,3-dioxygenase-like lactoylglutathione lyase family enzyme